MIRKAQENPKITFLWNSVVESIHALDNVHDSLHHICVKNVLTDQTNELLVDGLFVAIGHQPNSQVFQNGASRLQFDNTGYIIRQQANGTSNCTATHIPGIFVAGDISDPTYRQAITAAGMGCSAALDAQRFLEEQQQH